jgi:hypothetical protein
MWGLTGIAHGDRPMAEPNAHLASYLNDHLAGATAALDMLAGLSKAYASREVAALAGSLRAEVDGDRNELERIRDSLGVAPSPARAAAAWVAERFARLKIRADDPARAGLDLLETLEALSLGIEGKRLLWRSLSAAAEVGPTFRVADYEALIRRADDQRARVERWRLDAARRALVAGPNGNPVPATSS